MSASSSEKKDTSCGAACAVEERCPICLDDFQDKAFITSCFHAYCFECVVKAALVSGNRCPMCKIRFTKVIHNVRANDDYELYKIPPPEPANSASRRQALSDLDEAISNFRGYRTTMFPGRPAGDDSSARGTVTTFSSGPEPHEGTHWGGMAGDHVLVHISLPSGSSSSGHAPTASRQGPRHQREFGRSVRRSDRCAPVAMRRAVYSAKVRALPLEDTKRKHRPREISAACFRRNQARTHRLGPWLSREFETLLGEEHVEFMMQLVFSLIDKVDLESDSFETHLRPFLSDRTPHFMHELVSFAKSPFDIVAYDGKVRYNWPANYPVPAGPWTSGQGASRTEAGEGSSGQEASTEQGSSFADSGLSAELRQRLFDELTEPSNEIRLIDVPDPSSRSPIFIHDSDSEFGDPRDDSSGQGVAGEGIEINSPGLSREESSSQRSGDESTTYEAHSDAIRGSSEHLSRSHSSVNTALQESIATSCDIKVSEASPLQLSLPCVDDTSACSTRLLEQEPQSSNSAGTHLASLQESQQSGTACDEICVFVDEEEASFGSLHDSAVDDGRTSSGPGFSSKGKNKVGSAEKKHKSQHKKHKKKHHRVRRDSPDRHSGRRSTSREKRSDYRKKHHRHKSRSASADRRSRQGVLPSKKSANRSRRGSSSLSPPRTKTRGIASNVLLSSPPTREKSSSLRGNKARGVHHSSPPIKKSGRSKRDECLYQEEEAIEEEIRASKRQLLKSALKKERIELLHRNLRGSTGVPEKVGVVGAVGVGSLRDELSQLNEEIISEKRRLLKVVKRMEEQNADGFSQQQSESGK